MWKIFVIISFLTGGQLTSPEGANVPNPWKIEHRQVWDSKDACEAALKDDTVTQVDGIKFVVMMNMPGWIPAADDFKLEFTCEEKTDG